ncbi:MAG: tetratricopeptide repeat protein [Anaerolineae bacterium]|nr:tetratricopeptide repeat protein [Anaerolineae bacterium]
MEGETFTAQAVAEALEIDPDDLMDFLDDYLCRPPEGAGTAAEGIVCEVGFVNLPRGSVFQYRFARPYLHHVFAKYPAREADRRIWSGRLAETLERLHYPFTNQIADALYRLFMAAGLRERAEAFRRLPIITPSLETLRWQVHLLRATVTDEDPFGTYRLFDAGFQLCGLIAQERPDLWEEGYEVSLDLLERARRLGERRKQAEALYYAAWHLQNGGFPAWAFLLARESVQLYRDFHPFSTDLARALNLLGNVFFSLKDLAGARASFENALGIWETLLGREHPYVAISLDNLGNVLQGLGDLGEAWKCHKRASQILEARLGPEHPDVAIALNNLGVLLWAQGDLPGAREHFQRALDILKARLGPEHPGVTTALNGLGNVLWAQGDLVGAQACFEQVLRIRETCLGPEHPDVAAALNNLGSVLRDLGDLDEARACFERALGILRKRLPLSHPYIRILEEKLQDLEGGAD